MSNATPKGTLLNDCTPIDLTRALPAPLKEDPQMLALGQVIAGELLENIRLSKRNIIYARIDELDEPMLDILAYDLHVDWYDPDSAIDVKRAIIKDSVNVHKYGGTKYAVETALGNVFPGTRVQEWFEYGGQPHRFRIILDITNTNINVNYHTIKRAAEFYKRLAAHLDDVIYQIASQFLNQNRIVLIDLATKIAIKNRTAMASGIILDGAHLLDGSWILTSAFPGLPLIDFAVFSKFQNMFRFASALSMAIYRWTNSFSLSAGAEVSLSATNVGSLALTSATITGLSATQTYDLTGTVLMDGRWTLGGEYTLNGAMRLNAFYEEKEL